MQAYIFKMLHRASKVHQNADGLSRLPISCHLMKEAERLYKLISQKDQWEFKNRGDSKNLGASCQKH